jgi:hypothetical protein
MVELSADDAVLVKGWSWKEQLLSEEIHTYQR